LDSIINQTYNNKELIIIDGLSVDCTLNLINKRIRNLNYVKVISETDNGIYDAINKGIKLATGDVIGFVHSDDILASKTIISSVVSKLKERHLDGVYGNVLHFNSNNFNKITRYWKSKPFKPNLIKQGWMPPHPSLFLKKSVYDRFGLFNTRYKISADYDFMLRIFKDNSLKIKYIDLLTHKMRNGGASNGSIVKLFKIAIEDFLVIRANNIGGVKTLISKKLLKLNQL
jgi:glycosyltransferase